MHAPEYVCRELHRLHPHLRLAWAGKPKQSLDEMNAGSFAIVQNYHISDCGDMDDPDITYREYWNITTKAIDTGWGDRFERVRAYRGPIFARDGSTKLDYDPLSRIPIWVMNIDESFQDADGNPLKRSDVFSGKVLKVVKDFLYTHIEDRIRTSALEKGKGMEAKAQDHAGAMADFLWFQANKVGATGPTVAKKHVTDQDLGKYNRFKRGEMDFTEYHMPPKAKGRGTRK